MGEEHVFVLLVSVSPVLTELHLYLKVPPPSVCVDGGTQSFS